MSLALLAGMSVYAVAARPDTVTRPTFDEKSVPSELTDALAGRATIQNLDASFSDSALESLFPMEAGERIERDKSLVWAVDEKKFYFFPVSYKKQTCRFVFVDASDMKVISDGGFYLDDCTFISRPELIDINNDGVTDFRVRMKLGHQIGSSVRVKHSLDFIYDGNKKMYCETDSGMPCN
ncbi:hypothetical protein [Pseudoxanthomonas putridarboris]|uniref:Uncharacterized protein n=1 Tax=Pseudoxanthomonas putridarboris TaxID=752605 RepID=A0ABU9J730_9GAMM